MQSTGKGFVTYTATEYNMDGDIAENLVSYYDIEVEEGDQLVGTVAKVENDSVLTYSLSKDGEELTPNLNKLLINYMVVKIGATAIVMDYNFITRKIFIEKKSD